MYVGQSRLLFNGSQDCFSIMPRQMQVQDYDARFRGRWSHALAMDKSNGLLAVAKQIKVIFFSMMVEGQPKQVHIRWIILHDKKLRGVCVFAHAVLDALVRRLLREVRSVWNNMSSRLSASQSKPCHPESPSKCVP